MKFADLKATTQLTWPSASRRKPGTAAKDTAGVIKIEQPEEIPGLINGQPAGSSYEWNTARALWALGWRFGYQVPVLGGRQVRGGQVLDFYVYTVPLATALIVNGDYWHQTDEGYKNDELMTALLREGKSVKSEPIVLWAAQAATYQAAYSYLYSKIGKG